MKKFTAIIITVLMHMSAVCANNAVPSFLTTPMTNYTANYNLSIIFDNAQETVELLEEVEMPKQVEYFVDAEMLLKTLLSYSGNVNLQSNISKDYRKIQLGITADSDRSVAINPNLNMTVDAKMGMWLNMDFVNEANPVFDIVYQQPFFNKYMKISESDVSATDEILDMFKSILNKEYIASLQKASSELFITYSDVKSSAGKYTFSMDNDSFVKYLNKLILLLCDKIPDFDKETSIPDLSGLQFLGEKGILIEVVLSDGNIKTEKFAADISIDLSKIYPLVSGMPWEYQSEGKLEFTVLMNTYMSKIGKTTVKFPQLTSDNSFTLEDLYDRPQSEDEDFAPGTEAAPYPLWYVGEECDYLSVVDGEVYIPLRQTLEAAFEDSVSITYDDDKITLKSEYFEPYRKIIININSDKALIDNKEVQISKPFLREWRTYVSSSFFTDIFGWEFGYASHDLVRDNYQYTFYTDTY